VTGRDLALVEGEVASISLSRAHSWPALLAEGGKFDLSIEVAKLRGTRRRRAQVVAIDGHEEGLAGGLLSRDLGAAALSAAAQEYRALEHLGERDFGGEAASASPSCMGVRPVSRVARPGGVRGAGKVIEEAQAGLGEPVEAGVRTRGCRNSQYPGGQTIGQDEQDMGRSRAFGGGEAGRARLPKQNSGGKGIVNYKYKPGGRAVFVQH